VNPTGTGKTVVFATLPIFHQLNKRILVLVHRDTLAKQAKKAINFWNPDITVGVEQGTQRSNGTERVVVGSVQTLGRPVKLPKYGRPGKIVKVANSRLTSLNPDDFDAVIVDEAHHSVASGYMIIFRHFGFLDENFKKTQPAPNRLLLGVTATPKRRDGKRLDQIFDKKIYEYFIDEAIREGWLVNVRCWRVKTDSTLDGVRTLGDDLQRDELAKAVNNPARNRRIVVEWLRLAGDRPTIVFAVDVAHTQALAEEFCRHGIKAGGIWGGDPNLDTTLKSFADGDLQVLVNCELLTEGFDESRVSCVVLARPTESESLFKQMVGRGTRLEKGIDNLLEALAQGRTLTKPDCLVLDVVDATSELNSIVNFGGAYGLPKTLNMCGEGLLQTHDAVTQIVRQLKTVDPKAEIDPARCANLGALQEYMRDLLPAPIEEVDLLQVRFDDAVMSNSQLQWHRLDFEQYVLMLPRHAGACFLTRNKDGFHVLEGNLEPPLTSFKDVGTIHNRPFGEGFAYADRAVHARLGAATVALCDRRCTDGWRAHPATDPQRRALAPSFRAQGKELSASLTKGEANLLITLLQVKKAHARPRPTAMPMTA
jgi:superfamily II DNA or RNA helicase